MNTTPTTPEVTNDIESNEQLLALIRTQASTLIMGTMFGESYTALEKTVAKWATKYGTVDNAWEIEKEIGDAIDACCPSASDTRRPIMLAMLYKVMANGFMQTIEQLKTGEESPESAATPAIQNETTETLGSVFAAGYFPKSPPTSSALFTSDGRPVDDMTRGHFPKSPPTSSALFTSDGRPVDDMTRMILTEGFPTGGLGPTNQKTASIDQG